MKSRLFRVLLLLSAVACVLTPGSPVSNAAPDGVEDPLPCELVCVPVPTFPFLVCAPSCPSGPPPGGGPPLS